MRKVFLKYGFIFEPTDTWPTQSNFEDDMSHFFNSKGFKAEIVETAQGQENVPVIYLTKVNQQAAEADIEFKEEDGKPTS